MKLQNLLFLVPCSIFILASCSVSKQINKQADTILLKDTAISTGHIGISIYEPATNTYWYNYNADKYFIPASNTKLFTLYAGMKYLGDSLVGARYYVKLQQLYLVPSGDPTFLNSEFAIQKLFDLLKHNDYYWVGLELTKERWRTEKYGRGWAWDDYAETYAPQRSAFPIYGNLATFVTTQDSIFIDSDSTKLPIKVMPEFLSHYIEPDIYARPLLYKYFKIEKNFDENKFIIKNANKTIRTQTIPFNTDFAAIGALLSDTLQKATYSKRAFSMGSTLFKNDSSKLITIHSQPTDSLFKPMMHRSDNFFAEQTLLMVSNEHLGYMSDEKIIDTLLNSDLKDVPQKPKWVDGSGLSRYNLFTPQSFVYILTKMKTEFGWDRMKNILPTGGTGTLLSYFKKDSGFIYAKTGTLSNNCTLSGYLITEKGKLLIFSVLANNYITGATPVRKAVEHFLLEIRKKY
ncbi:MAG: D-alanyl-D-alanine carboxypeptidase [Ferruginibacter sp.]